jgi:hypothetical protein
MGTPWQRIVATAKKSKTLYAQSRIQKDVTMDTHGWDGLTTVAFTAILPVPVTERKFNFANRIRGHFSPRPAAARLPLAHSFFICR